MVVVRATPCSEHRWKIASIDMDKSFNHQLCHCHHQLSLPSTQPCNTSSPYYNLYLKMVLNARYVENIKHYFDNPDNTPFNLIMGDTLDHQE